MVGCCFLQARFFFFVDFSLCGVLALICGSGKKKEEEEEKVEASPQLLESIQKVGSETVAVLEAGSRKPAIELQRLCAICKMEEKDLMKALKIGLKAAVNAEVPLPLAYMLCVCSDSLSFLSFAQAVGDKMVTRFDVRFDVKTLEDVFECRGVNRYVLQRFLCMLLA